MTSSPLYLISVPGLRSQDVARMDKLRQWTSAGEQTSLAASFPAITWPVQANMLTGKLANEHGVIANGFFWRDKHEVEMWTAWNDKIQQPQLWDHLHRGSSPKKSAVWFPMLSKGCGADNICMPAPIHNPDGSESLWCYTKPVELYGELRDSLGHFPLKHFWGPLAGIPSSKWITQSAAFAAKKFSPDFFYIYVPHLDYAAQKSGPNSPGALQAVVELDGLLDEFFQSVSALNADATFLVVSEYVITEVKHVLYPNRILREAGLVVVKPEQSDKPFEQLDFIASQAWALVDHQFSHIFVRDRDSSVISRVVDLFKNQVGVAEVLAGDQLAKYGLNHERSGDVVVISNSTSWQAYYWWQDDALAPSYARTVDIHRKPGYDPVELHFDPVNRCIPLDATLIRGSHGAPPVAPNMIGVALSNKTGIVGEKPLRDVDIFECVMRNKE